MSMLVVEFFGIVVAVFVCILVSLAWHFRRQHQKYDHLPGPPRDSFWKGHIPSIGKVRAAGGIMDDYLIEVSKTYGLVFRLYIWNQVLIVVLDPEHIKDVLVTGNHQRSKRFYSQAAYIFDARFMGEGLETQLDSKHWIVQRMHFDPWFKPSVIRQFASEFNVFADRFTEYMETSADGKTEINLMHSFYKLTLHLLYKVAFNVDMGPLHGKNHPFATKMKTAMSGYSEFLANPLVAVDPFKWKYRRKVRDAVNFIRDSVQQLMIDRKVAKSNGDYTPHDLLEYMLELKEKYPSLASDDLLLDNFMTFVLAGQETSASTMSFTLALLGQNPECYRKLQREVDENVGAVSVISLNEIEKLPYLDMVLKETLRLYPPARLTFRETATDYNLGGHLIPAGTDMSVSFYATSRVEQNVKNPTKFIPERFSNDSSEKLNKYVSTPFSAGPHTCIGRKFAQILMKITIAKIMQTFDFELVPGQTLGVEEHMTIQPRGGVRCFFRPRKTV